jgi:hypothetical protein
LTNVRGRVAAPVVVVDEVDRVLLMAASIGRSEAASSVHLERRTTDLRERLFVGRTSRAADAGRLDVSMNCLRHC